MHSEFRNKNESPPVAQKRELRIVWWQPPVVISQEREACEQCSKQDQISLVHSLWLLNKTKTSRGYNSREAGLKNSAQSLVRRAGDRAATLKAEQPTQLHAHNHIRQTDNKWIWCGAELWADGPSEDELTALLTKEDRTSFAYARKTKWENNQIAGKSKLSEAEGKITTFKRKQMFTPGVLSSDE